ncbi:uncharacterized protein LOC131023089 [Salvia miltiorrhiza]|uniref:uncharacterized protein LOC131023089 n=1 Tax=Salvia miltiorrhiza TaxID=226208 RepID=UPI0025ABBF55|nr:uncharacterized protein LOC131023089 [Salvia miltiorrhiza]
MPEQRNGMPEKSKLPSSEITIPLKKRQRNRKSHAAAAHLSPLHFYNSTHQGQRFVNALRFFTLKERVSFDKEIKKSKFIAIAAPISDERSTFSFIAEVREPRATHNCWAYKIGDQFRSNDDGEPSGTVGKPIQSAIESSGIDRVMVVVIRYFGGIKLGTGGLVRAYRGVAAECLRNAPTCLVKSKVIKFPKFSFLCYFSQSIAFDNAFMLAPVGLHVTFDLLGVLYIKINKSCIIPKNIRILKNNKQSGLDVELDAKGDLHWKVVSVYIHRSGNITFMRKKDFRKEQLVLEDLVLEFIV